MKGGRNLFSLLEKSELTYPALYEQWQWNYGKQGRLRRHYECVIFINSHFIENRDKT